MYPIHSILTTFILTSLLVPTTLAWGSLGHRTVAYLASLYFTTPAHHLTAHLLNGQDLSDAAIWADRIRPIPAFKWSSTWHYIDAHDNPPYHCGIELSRDCLAEESCVVNAIANQTDILLSAPSANTSHYALSQAFRFLIHFFGDVHQPLHTELLERGGNEITVYFDRRKTNLHAVWDDRIVEKMLHFERVHGDREAEARAEREAAMLWALRLEQMDRTPVDNECLGDAVDCALEWATEANQWVCRYVLAGGREAVEEMDLGGEYFDGAVPIIDDLVLKAGRRLAAWVNFIAEANERKLQVQEL